jgi:hypothetical protein
MKLSFNTIAGLVLLLSIDGCDTQPETPVCEEGDVRYLQTFFNDKFGRAACRLQGIDPNTQVVNFVIRNQVDYEKHVVCGHQPPAVDFGKYFLLAGRYLHHQCALFGDQQVMLCNNTIVYRVRMTELICAAFTNVWYFAVIEKRYENLPVVFDVGF